MKHTDPFSDRQLRSLAATALLSPILRLVPGTAAELGGKAAWAGPLAVLPLLLLYAALLARLERSMAPGETLPELALRALGPRGGGAMLLILAGWLLLYCGFLLRSGAERLLVTVYPRSRPGLFVISMGLLSLFAALGPFRSLLRTARMAAPLLLLSLGLILLKALQSLDPTELLPLTPADAGSLLCAGLPALDLVSFALAVLFFFRPAQPEGAGRFRRGAGWTALLCLLLTAVGAAVQGRFGAALSARLSAPFFALVRNLVFFRSLERLEALVVGLWILPDFLLTSLCLHGAQRCLRLALGCPPRPRERRWSLANGRLLIWLCGALVLALGLLLGRDPAALLLWSRRRIPLLSLAVSFLAVPMIFFLGKMRKKL